MTTRSSPGSPPALGDHTLDLRVGERRFRWRGLDDATREALGNRWQAFIETADLEAPIVAEVEVVDAGDRRWVPPPRPKSETGRLESYRVEPMEGGIASYHFALLPEGDSRWRLHAGTASDEPVIRMLDNAARFLVSRDAVDAGGFALHGAAVVRDGAAWIFTGPSRAGKTTAVELSAPCISLGDDFALLRPREGVWCVTPVPFDNTDRVGDRPVGGWFPVAGILRMHQAAGHRVEDLPGVLASASLMSCAAMPWAMPERADRLLEQIGRYLQSGTFRHLHFSRDPGFWELLA